MVTALELLKELREEIPIYYDDYDYGYCRYCDGKPKSVAPGFKRKLNLHSDDCIIIRIDNFLNGVEDAKRI